MIRSTAALLFVLAALAAPLSAGSPELVVDPDSLSFAARIIGTTSDYQTFTIGNAGQSQLNYGVAVTGPHAGDFEVTCWDGSSDCLEGSIPANFPSVTVYVYFTPLAEGLREATVEVTSYEFGNPMEPVALYGTGGLFGDGFEDGTCSAWSFSQGCLP